jgi:hypothetical protein
MNDFLQSLRNGQAEKPRTPKTRKNTENSYHYTSNPRFHSYGGYQNNRNQGMKRPPAQNQSGNQTSTDEISATSLLAEAIENLSIYVETIVKTVKSRVETIDPKKPILRKRKKIVAKKAEEMVSTDNKLLSREAVMDIIHSMRAKGDTFDMVASRLVELGQPTFSGRGEWHAQTIHRLCNKK